MSEPLLPISAAPFMTSVKWQDKEDISMHNNLDNTIRSRQPTGDELVDMLNSTRPTGSKVHRDELEKRLLTQLQSNNEGISNMRAGHIFSNRKFPAILAATLVILIIGGALMIFSAGNGLNIPAASQATQTPNCDVHNIRSIDFINPDNPVDVYSRDDEDSEIIISRLLGWDFKIMGTNRDGDWIMFLREDGIVGWIYFDALDDSDYTIRACSGTDGMQSISAPPTINPHVAATVTAPVASPIPTSVIIVNGTPLAVPSELGQQIEAVEPLSIYASDDTESDALQQLEAGDQIEIIGQNYNREWIIVRLEFGYPGWVAMEDADKFIVTGELLDVEPETGEVKSLDATATPIPSVTPVAPTSVQVGCDVHNLGQASFHVPVDVYSHDDEDSEIIGTLEEGGRVYDILGANQEGDWIVLLWEDDVVGWIHYAALDIDDSGFQYCGRAGVTIVDGTPTVVPPTSQQATIVPTSTPITDMDGTPLASQPVLRPFIEATETLSVYASDDAESEVVQELEEGDIVEVIGQNYDGEWLVVRLKRGYVGWISLADEDLFTLSEGLIYSDPKTGEVRELDATATPIPSSTPFPPTALPPDRQ
jgi:uncharacterized protein YgiM (DUF1202 family)